MAKVTISVAYFSIFIVMLSCSNEKELKIDWIENASKEIEMQRYQYYDYHLVSGYNDDVKSNLVIDSFVCIRINELKKKYHRICVGFYKQSRNTTLRKINNDPDLLYAPNWLSGEKSSASDFIKTYYFAPEFGLISAIDSMKIDCKKIKSN